jgi:hypothetical protein
MRLLCGSLHPVFAYNLKLVIDVLNVLQIDLSGARSVKVQKDHFVVTVAGNKERWMSAQPAQILIPGRRLSKNVDRLQAVAGASDLKKLGRSIEVNVSPL